ncbi:chitosanase [Entomortierella parvispora]|uniref:Chitosanase n=1 Tax=Entomortierella parvispora TaxID=205924 RepID=A0A9P3HEW6_9FUNG|nr:chitosanase [Entomortierella parvispora]
MVKTSLSIFLLAVAAAVVNAESLPYCKGMYADNHSNCGKFHLPHGTDYNPNANGDIGYIKKTNHHFSSTATHNYAIMVTNTFENGIPQNDYSTCVNIGDGRGYTCGSIGFTSDDGSMLDPIDRYGKLLKPKHKKNPFDKYLKTLDRNSNSESGSTSGLGGISTMWTHLGCTDSLFRKAQDEAGAAEVEPNAFGHAAYANVKSNLGLLIFRDSEVQHGSGNSEPHIGVEAIMKVTASELPKKHTEAQYLSKFLEVRRQLLCCYRPDGDTTWPESADRISDLQSLVKTRNWALKAPFRLPAYTQTITRRTPIYIPPKSCRK